MIYHKWCTKADEIKLPLGCKIKVSTILEGIATEAQRAKELDIADYMIEKLKSKINQTQVQIHFTPELQLMMVENPAHLRLIDKLEIIEV